MKMKRLIAQVLLPLSLVVFFAFHHAEAAHGYLSFQNGNGSIDEDPDRNTPGSGPVTVDWDKHKGQLESELKTAVQGAKSAVDNSNNTVAKNDFKRLSKDADTLIADLKKAKRAEDLETRVNKLKGQLQGVEKRARGETVVVVATPTPTPPENKNTNRPGEKETSKDDPTVLTYGNIVSTAALLLALASLGLLIFVFFSLGKRLNLSDDAHQRAHQSVEGLRKKLGDTKAYAESVGASLSRVQDDLGLQIESARRSSDEARKIARSLEYTPVAPEPLRADAPAEAAELEPSFPALVSDYLNQVRGSRKKEVEADFRTNSFVPSTDGSAPFTFIEDLDGSGAGIVLPKSRLQRSQEFSSYYKSYYHCAEPSAGEVYIVEPAIVERDGSGWRLRHMGRMEIR
jgi:hypothetical protein